MKSVHVVLLSLAFLACAGIAMAEDLEPGARKVLYVYDEVNKNSEPYIGYFRKAFTEASIAFDEASVADIKGKNLADYRAIVMHGMVMAFNSKSELRDWLKTSPDLKDRKVSLFVTANRWFLDNLYRDLTGLLKKDGADVIDAVSQATKNLNEEGKMALVKAQVSKLK
jgi:hypothetical protein